MQALRKHSHAAGAVSIAAAACSDQVSLCMACQSRPTRQQQLRIHVELAQLTDQLAVEVLQPVALINHQYPATQMEQ